MSYYPLLTEPNPEGIDENWPCDLGTLAMRTQAAKFKGTILSQLVASNQDLKTQQ